MLVRQHGIEYQNLALFREKMTGDRPFIVDTKNVYDPAVVEAHGLKLERL